MKKYSLPNMEFPFSIQITGEESGIQWTGKFLYRRPNLLERSRIDSFRVNLNGDLLTLKQETFDFNEAVSHLRHTLVEAPEWWTEADMGGALYDGNIVKEIYSKCMEFEKRWKEKVTGGKAEEVEAGKNEIKDVPASTIAAGK